MMSMSWNGIFVRMSVVLVIAVVFQLLLQKGSTHVSEMLDATHGQQQPQRASTSNVNRPSISNHGLYAAEFQSFV
ncbi:hypothetical protein Tco_0172027 [Tanacetum coccineum]